MFEDSQINSTSHHALECDEQFRRTYVLPFPTRKQRLEYNQTRTTTTTTILSSPVVVSFKMFPICRVCRDLPKATHPAGPLLIDLNVEGYISKENLRGSIVYAQQSELFFSVAPSRIALEELKEPLILFYLHISAI